MKICFWQNIMSIHQSAFLRNLAENNVVTLVVEKKVSEDRLKHGWTIPHFGKTIVIIAPDNDCIQNLLNDSEYVHIFTGIQSFKLASEVFLLAVEKKLKIGVQLEPFNWLGIKGKLRFLKYLYLRFKYNNSINFILAIGLRGRDCFEKTGFDKNKIYDWGYFTEQKYNKCFSSIKNIERISILPKILFVGSIDARKNILNVLPIIKRNQSQIDEFVIIGKGPLENELTSNIEGSKIVYQGAVNNGDITTFMEKADLLILPSVFDGWGAVVNEALMVGTPVLVSNNCGASALISEKRGAIFSIDKKNLEEVLLNLLKILPYDNIDREAIIKWSAESISGQVASEYFTEIIESVYHNSKKPIAPWLLKSN